MDRGKVEKFDASGLKTSSIPLKNPERVKERGSWRCGRTARNIRGWESAERRVTKWVEEGFDVCRRWWCGGTALA